MSRNLDHFAKDCYTCVHATKTCPNNPSCLECPCYNPDTPMITPVYVCKLQIPVWSIVPTIKKI